jgi:hypothetical protein
VLKCQNEKVEGVIARRFHCPPEAGCQASAAFAKQVLLLVMQPTAYKPV